MSGELVSYGIQCEQSDIRIHVCVTARRVYVYETRAALDAIRTGKFRTAPAYTGSQRTAEGYLVPPECIPGCRSIGIPDDWFIDFSKSDRTSVKGQKAVALVSRLAQTFGLPIPTPLQIVTDTREQISGVDIIVEPPLRRAQVKCDWDGGSSKYGGTGNLYLQIAESNPYRQV